MPNKLDHWPMFSLIIFILSFSACAEETVPGVDVSFRSDYIKLHDCKQSMHPAANYVVTWLSPEALPVWEAVGDGEMTQDFEEGTISIKAQYSDESCNSLENYTVMTKTSTDPDAAHGGWRWDFANQDFECINCDAGASCAGCHGGCTSGPTLFCTTP